MIFRKRHEPKQESHLTAHTVTFAVTQSVNYMHVYGNDFTSRLHSLKVDLLECSKCGALIRDVHKHLTYHQEG